ncbi:MAG: indolepyruvate oxidoreductase subunit beta [Candidatus Hodarchaeales archaeon]
MNINSYQIVIAGVGGQGIVTLTELIGESAIKAGLKVTGAETHGMAQRGGSVVSHLRIGLNPIAPLIADGTADIILALEPSEALRHSKLIKSDGTIIYSTDVITPSNVTVQHKEYPPVEPIFEKISNSAKNVYPVKLTLEIQQEIGMRSLNIIILGAMVGFWEKNGKDSVISREIMLEVIKNRWPKVYEKNLKAFEFGRESILNITLIV